MRSITARLHKAEQIAIERARQKETGGCICPWGKQHVYFTFDNLTEEEAAEKYPDNKKYCPVCGGLNVTVNMAKDNFILEGWG